MSIPLIKDQEEINELYNFIKKYPLTYPNYNEWLLKCKKELELGYKKAFVCKKDNKIIANLIFQPHKGDPSLLEIKNIRVEEKYKRKKIFTLLTRDVIAYAKEYGFKKIIIDTHEDNVQVIKSLRKLGFVIESHESLYNHNIETVLTMDLTSESKSLDQIIHELQLKLKLIINELLINLNKLFLIKWIT